MLRTVLLFTIIYTILYYFGGNPMKFKSNIDPLYFAVTITSSVGFGDYIPTNDFAKGLVILHMIVLIFDVQKILYDNFKFKLT